MKENLDLIISICGDQPSNQELIEIGSDPNFVFQNDLLYAWKASFAEITFSARQLRTGCLFLV